MLNRAIVDIKDQRYKLITLSKEHSMNKPLLFSLALLTSLIFSGASLSAMEQPDNEAKLSDFYVLKGLFDDNQRSITLEGVHTFFQHFGLDRSTYDAKTYDTINRLAITPSDPGIPYISTYYPSQRKLLALYNTLNQIEVNDIVDIDYFPTFDTPEEEAGLWRTIKTLFTYSLIIDKKRS